MKRGKAKGWFESRIRDFSDNVSRLFKKDDFDSEETELKVRNSTPFHIENPNVPWGDFSYIPPTPSRDAYGASPRLRRTEGPVVYDRRRGSVSTPFGAEQAGEELPWLTDKPKRFVSKLEHPLSSDGEPLERPSFRETIEIRSQPKIDDSSNPSPSGADLAARRSPPPLTVDIESRCVEPRGTSEPSPEETPAAATSVDRGTNPNPINNNSINQPSSSSIPVAPGYHPYNFGERRSPRRYRHSVTFSRPPSGTEEMGAYYQPPYRPLTLEEALAPPVPNTRRSSEYSKGYTVKPAKFNGENWEAYKLQFESCARANKWGPEECGRYLAASLVGNAAYTLAMKDDGEWSFRDLWDALEERYGQPSSEYLIRNKLRKVRQQPNQPLQALADDILQLVKGCSSSQLERDRLAVDAFIEALGDVDVRRYLLENEPYNIQDALRKARKFNDIKSASGTANRNARVFGGNGHNGGPDPYEEIERLRNRQAYLEQELRQARQGPAPQDPRKYNNAPRGGHNGSNHGGGRSSDNPNWRRHDNSA